MKITQQALCWFVFVCLVFLCVGCTGSPGGDGLDFAQPELGTSADGAGSDPDPEDPELPSSEAPEVEDDTEGTESVTKYRLIFPENHVITAEWNPGFSDSYSERYYTLSKDQISKGLIWYERLRIPFSDELLEHPDHAHFSWYAGNHHGVTDRWEISLNDGWVCYLYEGYFDTTVPEHPGDIGVVYGAMIGQPGEMFVFNVDWQNFSYNTVDEFRLDLLEEGDPGYVSLEEIRSFVSGITVESYAEEP